MAFLFVSFVAGALTVLAPCILPLLPVVIGSSATGRSRFTPYVVVGSLGLSVIAFTFLLKATTAFIAIPPQTWTYLSGGILILFGATLVFPALWERFPGIASLSAASNKAVGAGYQKKSLWGDALIGAALGPVFSTCSPTYFVILASVLPASFALGTTYLLAYVFGLSFVLLALALLGERLASRLGALADPKGWFKRIIGVLFIALGIFIIGGYDKKVQTAILDSGFFDITKVEQILLERLEGGSDASPQEQAGEEGALKDENNEPRFLTAAEKEARYEQVPELRGIKGYLNTGGQPITLEQYKGKNVVLIDFWTYSCINCQRTLPYLTAWDETYRDDGLVIVGVHTPEFAFEQVRENVAEAMAKAGIEYPVVQDNDYATWRAFENNYWPRKYLVDIDGYIVYDHAGEGAYDETEEAIRRALAERKARLGEGTGAGESASVSVAAPGLSGSPEIYFGAWRNDRLGNGTPRQSGTRTYTLPPSFPMNTLYFGGTWNIEEEYAEAREDATVVFRYFAKDVYMVAESEESATVSVLHDGAEVGDVAIGASTLYTLISGARAGEHVLELRIPEGVRLYTFTFGG